MKEKIYSRSDLRCSKTLRFCASTFGAVCGKQHEKLCWFSFIFSSHHHETSPHSTVNLQKPKQTKPQTPTLLHPHSTGP
ncbi:hypothetical protein DVH24_002174 [Malus domestica]|uniref:Uncharacterized protein n=1 Tax=Malus domestica TaxID=3750 RepID=A0A498I574_MALDO|nr:hypothetical protein DVH24_002174 [Malus domestica]